MLSRHHADNPQPTYNMNRLANSINSVLNSINSIQLHCNDILRMLGWIPVGLIWLIIFWSGYVFTYELIGMVTLLGLTFIRHTHSTRKYYPSNYLLCHLVISVCNVHVELL